MLVSTNASLSFRVDKGGVCPVSSFAQMVFQACNHPFVLQMDYAFQTELHAIIVLNLVTTGNLQVGAYLQ